MICAGWDSAIKPRTCKERVESNRLTRLPQLRWRVDLPLKEVFILRAGITHVDTEPTVHELTACRYGSTASHRGLDGGQTIERNSVFLP